MLHRGVSRTCFGIRDLSDDHIEEEAPELGTLPLDAWHRSLGARMVPFAGYEMPIQYAGDHGGIVAQHFLQPRKA